MNKFEKLIEYIINDEDQKARDLFHTIVVEKSRDIYESIMDEEQVEENFGGPVAGEQVEELTNQLADEEAVGEADEEGEEEFSLDQDGEDDDEMGGEMPAEVGHDEEAEEDKIMNIDAKLDELLAKFDEIMGDTGSDEMGAEMPGEEPSMDDMGAEQEPQMFEAEEADESDDEEDEDEPKDKEEDKKEEAKESRNNSRKLSTSELMREYVDRIGDIYGGAGDAAEGDAVAGSGKKTSVNTKSVTGPGADFGGTAVKSKGSESNPDGTSAPSSEKPQEIKSGNINVPGGKAGSSFKTKEAAKSGEGQTTDGSVPTNDKSPVRK
jgi:hypothetical protein